MFYHLFQHGSWQQFPFEIETDQFYCNQNDNDRPGNSSRPNQEVLKTGDFIHRLFDCPGLNPGFPDMRFFPGKVDRAAVDLCAGGQNIILNRKERNKPLSRFYR